MTRWHQGIAGINQRRQKPGEGVRTRELDWRLAARLSAFTQNFQSERARPVTNQRERNHGKG